MTRKLLKSLEFISIHIMTLRQKASTMNDEVFGKWSRKALEDLSLGCVGDDVDPMVKAAFDDSFETAKKSKERRRAAYERQKRSSGNSEKQNNLPAKLPEQLTYGARENVYLTQDQFNDLAAKVGNLNEARDLIDNLSYKLAEGSHKSNDHFATLCYWIECRKAKTTVQEPRKESQMERNFRIANEAMERIAKGETPRWRP